MRDRIADILLGLMTGPTDAMVRAGMDAEECTPDDEGPDVATICIWEAMIRKAKG